MRFYKTACALLLIPLLSGCSETFSNLFKPSQDNPVVVAANENPTTTAVTLPRDDQLAVTAQVQQLSEEEYLISRVQVGSFPCGNSVHVNVKPDPANPKEFLVEGQGFSYKMRPVLTKSGAIRLEDSEGGLVWLQVATKSMLMNQKAGRRLADACLSPAQIAKAQQLGAEPQIPLATPVPAPAPAAAPRGKAKAKTPAARRAPATKK